mgnify:CR=1 FL=1
MTFPSMRRLAYLRRRGAWNVVNNDGTLGVMKEPYTEGTVTCVIKVLSLFILQVSHIKFIVTNVGGVIIGIPRLMPEISTSLDLSSNNSQSYNMNLLEWHCSIKIVPTLSIQIILPITRTPIFLFVFLIVRT